MKFINQRPYADPAVAARKLLEIANATDAVQDGRIHIEKINGHFLFKEGGTPEEYSAGLKFAIDQAPRSRWCHRGSGPRSRRR